MSQIDELIKKDIQKNPKLAKQYRQVSLNLDAAVLIKEMRSDLGMTQKEFANYVGKPQSTIGRIEAGSMNVTVKLLDSIAASAHRKIKLVLV